MKVLNFIICLLIFGVMALPLHEAGHSFAAQVCGVSGYIELDFLNYSGWYFPGDSLTGWQYTFVAYAGGVLAAAVMGLLLVFAYVGRRWDEDDLTALRVVIGMQLGYGIGEGLQSPLFAGIGAMVGILAALVYSLPKLLKWWRLL